jgi:FKBP-type peptidyl-prolyl cis-trans isomerase
MQSYLHRKLRTILHHQLLLQILSRNLSLSPALNPNQEKTSQRKTSQRKTSQRKTSQRKTSQKKTSQKKTSQKKTSQKKTSQKILNHHHLHLHRRQGHYPQVHLTVMMEKRRLDVFRLVTRPISLFRQRHAKIQDVTLHSRGS